MQTKFLMISNATSFFFLLLRPTTECIAGYKANVEERIGIPDKPRKPLTPYFRFMKEIRPSFVAKNPDLKQVDIIKGIAKIWNEEIDQKKKDKLQEDFKKEQVSIFIHHSFQFQTIYYL